MIKESTHRADELKELGWSSDDVARYIELWDYRQRWGAINLEREDRQFLRKAEASLPVITTSKTSVKKPIEEKSYYRRLRFFLEAMESFESKSSIGQGAKGIWVILLEEELRVLDYFQPVLGLPDSLKAKQIEPFREAIITRISERDPKGIQTLQFDVNEPLEKLKRSEPSKWRPLREIESSEKNNYPVLKGDAVELSRMEIRTELPSLIRELFPSLSDSGKPLPPDDWSR